MSVIHPGFRRPILVYPTILFFDLPVTKDVALAPTPGTFDAAAAAEYGRIGVPEPMTIDHVHLHHEVDGTSGSTVLELWRRRDGVLTQIGSLTLAHGGGPSDADFNITDVKLLRDDYLHLQATEKMGGTPIGFVNVHFEAIRK